MLIFIGLGLILCGCFALFLSINQQFLPHDVQFLGITAEELCGIKNCRVVHFMFHDRVAFGGALISVGALYMWMAEFPLRQGEAWAQNRGSGWVPALIRSSDSLSNMQTVA